MGKTGCLMVVGMSVEVMMFAGEQIQFLDRDSCGCEFWRFGRELEVVEDLAKYGRVGDECEYDHGRGTPGTGQGIHIECAAQ